MLKAFFEQEKIEYYASLSPEDVTLWDREKYDRMEAQIGKIQSVVVFLIPYNAGQVTTNLSVYAQVRDYHLYLRQLSERLDVYLKENGILVSFRGFADSSPLAERETALAAGLGVMGENGLLIHPKYGSFFFIGAFFLTRCLMPNGKKQEPGRCSLCGACKSACPTHAISDPKRERCLSLISQKKNRTPEEDALLEAADCKWGCDLCQNVCPMNQKAALTPIPFFQTDHISHLTPESAELPKKEFLSRAFSWRGRELIRKNLKK
ncbi:MAG: epoxyqueuosine reductase [Clostridia bacterium]|nr:epoxyqueuosine reductase [Clostridia bacterium]